MRFMYPVADKLPNEIERAAFVEALALIGTDQQDEFYAFCEIGKLLSGYSKTMVSLIDSTHQCVLSGISLEPDADRSWPCLLYTSPSPRDKRQSRMPSSA